MAALACGAVLAVAVAPLVPIEALGWAGAALIAASLAAPRLAPELIGAALGAWAVATLPPGPVLDGPYTVQGVVVGAAVGNAADVTLTRVARPGGSFTPIAGRVRARFPAGAPAPGTAVIAFGHAGPYEPSALPGEPDPARNATRARVATLLRVRTWAPLGGTPRRPDPFRDARHAGILRALALGDRAELDDATWRLLRDTGTAHLVSISGSHVGVIALGFGGTAAVLLRALGRFLPRGLPLAPAWAFGAAVAAAYAIATGAPVSAQRAAGMLVLAAAARTLGRDADPLSLLGAAAVLVLVADPAAIGTAGFQLSFGALLGLIRVTPWLLRFLPPDRPAPVVWLARATAATVGATVGTFPAAAWWFQHLSVTTVPANLIAVPWVGFVVLPAAVVGAFVPGPVGGVAVRLADLAVGGLLAGLRPLAVDGLGVAVGPVGAVALSLPLVRPSRLAAVLAVVLLLATVPSPAVREGVRVTFLDVGQGDAALVEADGRAWLVDGGPPSGRVAQWLRRRGTRRLEAVIASHGHPDHAGGLVEVLDAVRVGAVWVPDGEGLGELCAAAARRRVPVFVRPPGAVPAPADVLQWSLNDRSLAVVLGGVLFPGDAEAAGEQALVAAGVGPVDVVKIPHHGSRTSSTPALIAATRPVIAVASAGRGNRYGHPHDAVLARWAAAGASVWRTDRDGTVEVTLRDDGVFVRTHRAGRGWSAPVQVAAGPGGAAARRAPTKNTISAAAATTSDTPCENDSTCPSHASRNQPRVASPRRNSLSVRAEAYSVR